MEDTTDDEISIYEAYQLYYQADTLTNDSALNLKVRSALTDDFHLIISLILRCLSRCVGNHRF